MAGEFQQDPRIFFAAERTALAWNRTALALMAFGFAIDRFGMFKTILEKSDKVIFARPSFWVGLVFIALGCIFSTASAFQYRRVVKTLRPADIPAYYSPYLAFALNLIIAGMAAATMIYLFISDF